MSNSQRNPVNLGLIRDEGVILLFFSENILLQFWFLCKNGFADLCQNLTRFKIENVNQKEVTLRFGHTIVKMEVYLKLSPHILHYHKIYAHKVKELRREGNLLMLV